MKRAKLTVRLLRQKENAHLDRFLRIYAQSFNPDERVSPAILREVIKPSQDQPNHAQLFAAFEDRTMVGGAVMLLLPAFGVVFSSYIFVDPALRGAQRGSRILREVIRHEKKICGGPQPHASRVSHLWRGNRQLRRVVAPGVGARRLPLFPCHVAARLL